MANKDDYMWVYGTWSGHGWGAMLVKRSDLTRIAFKSEDTGKVKVFNKVLYKKVK